MAKLEVLISGAGIAGCTLAHWLTRSGHTVTVVERSLALRSSGSPVDVRGPAVDVVERMNIGPALRKASIHLNGMTLVNGEGRRVARVDIATLRSAIAPKDLEIARGDLARILYDACANDAEFVFRDSIKTLAQDERGVDVEFVRSRPRRFDLVVGADGLHSIVRRLAFGPDSAFVSHAGLYAATVALPGEDGDGELTIMNVAGKLAAIHPCQGAPLAYFVFWQAQTPDFDFTDLDQHKRILESTYAGIGWRAPEMLAAVRAAGDMYFDSVAQVDVPDWASGRVVLLGDAASCVSLFGDGSTLAIAGAYELAKSLEGGPSDLRGAFARYQAAHGPLVASKQKTLISTAARIVPRTPLGVWLSTRLFWRAMGGLGAAVRMGRKLRWSEATGRL